MESKKQAIVITQFMQRVVITGIGAVTPFGVGMEHCFTQLVNSCCAIKVSIVFHFLCSDSNLQNLKSVNAK